MQHYHSKDILYLQPEEFNKFSDRETLSYAIGSNLYMPALLAKKTVEKLKRGEFSDVTAMTFCLEDSVSDSELPVAEETLREALTEIYNTSEDFHSGDGYHKYPLFFVRVRSVAHFSSLLISLSDEQLLAITSFIFPKFDSQNGNTYFALLKNANDRIHKIHDKSILYGMPILESPNIIYIESRINELMNIKSIVDNNRDFVLNIRTGGTDFSAVYGVRRDVEHTIYDIKIVSDCIRDICNVFHRNLEYVISGPVWEHFPKSEKKLMYDLRQTPFQKKGLKSQRDYIFEKAIDGLIKECLLDIANGLNGKTTIHPSHVTYINSLHIVSYEDYMDAIRIKECSKNGGGVMKSTQGNKMSEVNPHQNWANNILARSRVFGVYKQNKSFIDVLDDLNIVNYDLND